MRSMKLLCLAALALVLAFPAAAQDQQPPADQPPVSPAPEIQPAPPVGQDQVPPAEGQVEQPAGDGAQGEGDQTQQQPKGILDNPMFLFVILGLFVLMMFWSSRQRRKQEKARREMLSGLKKGDDVTSIGGIVGKVIEVREDEVVVKVDETTNTRMTFARWAIRGIGETGKTEEQQKK